LKIYDPLDPPSAPLLWHPDGTNIACVVTSHASTVGEAMTAPALTIDPACAVAEAARLMVEHRFDRLPVASGGELVGIVKLH
jgi:CBS domain-containing protein